MQAAQAVSVAPSMFHGDEFAREFWGGEGRVSIRHGEDAVGHSGRAVISRKQSGEGLGQGLKPLLNFCRMDGPTEVVPLLQIFGVLGAAEAVATQSKADPSVCSG